MAAMIFSSAAVAAEGDENLFFFGGDIISLKITIQLRVLGAVAKKDGSRHFRPEEMEGVEIYLHSHWLNANYGEGNDVLAVGTAHCGVVRFTFDNPAVWVSGLDPFRDHLWLDAQVGGTPVWVYIPQQSPYTVYLDGDGGPEIGVVYYPDGVVTPWGGIHYYMNPLSRESWASCPGCGGYIR